jgi:two-component system LytT family response regulator
MISEHCFFNVDRAIVHINISNILFIECNSPKLKIFCTDDVWEVRMSLNQLQRVLPPRMFLRVHRSYLVSIAHMTSYKHGIVHMGEFEIPVQHKIFSLQRKSLNIINTTSKLKPKKVL